MFSPQDGKKIEDDLASAEALHQVASQMNDVKTQLEGYGWDDHTAQHAAIMVFDNLMKIGMAQSRPKRGLFSK